MKIFAAIPLSLYRKSVSGIRMLNSKMYDTIFNKYGSGNNPLNKHRIYIPLGKPPLLDTGINPNPLVLQYLSDNKFSLDNYKLGTAIMPDGKRTIKIGKAIRDPEVKKLFDNDPSRRGASQAEGNYLVVVSRHPYDVLGISFDRGWTSCTNLDEGMNSGKLKSSIKFGLIAAYLIKDTDKNINRPSSRILIRPYFQGTNVMLSADATEYGSSSPAFRNTLKKFLKWCNSGSPDGKYLAPRGMYLDSEEKFSWIGLTLDKIENTEDIKFLENPEDLKRILQKKDSKLSAAVASSPNATEDLLLITARDPAKIVREETANNPNSTARVLELLYKDRVEEVRVITMRNPNATEEMFKFSLAEDTTRMVNAIALNPSTPPEILDLIFDSASDFLKSRILRNPKVLSKTIIRVISLGSLTYNMSLAQDPNCREDVLAALIASSKVTGDITVSRAALKNPRIDLKMLSNFLNNKNYIVRSWACFHPLITPELLSISAKDSESFVRSAAFSRENIPISCFLDGLKDPDFYVRKAVLTNTSFSSNTELLDIAAKSPDPEIRYSVALSPAISQETLLLLSKDKDKDVREAVIEALSRNR